MKLKSTFTVAEEGYEQGDNEDEANLLQEFINYIKVRITNDTSCQNSIKIRDSLK